MMSAAIPLFKYVPFESGGEHRVLLVKQVCVTCSPTDDPIEAVSFLIHMVLDEKSSVTAIAKELQDSLETEERKSLISGEGKYIKAICALLSELFCEKRFEFTTEKIQ